MAATLGDEIDVPQMTSAQLATTLEDAEIRETPASETSQTPIADEELIEQPIDPTETHRAGNDRKERDLYTLLDRLSDLEAHAVRRRLSAARANDPLVLALARISIDRRVRVIAFIDDTRRRNAMRL